MADVDYASPTGQVRILIPDVEPLKDPRDLRAEAAFIFTDEQIGAFLALNGGNVKRAAADACDAIAFNEALVLKVLSTDDKSTDGAKLLEKMHARASSLRKQADADAVDDTAFRFIPFTVEPVEWAWH